MQTESTDAVTMAQNEMANSVQSIKKRTCKNRAEEGESTEVDS